jgi:hypothetical protein
MSEDMGSKKTRYAHLGSSLAEIHVEQPMDSVWLAMEKSWAIVVSWYSYFGSLWSVDRCDKSVLG